LKAFKRFILAIDDLFNKYKKKVGEAEQVLRHLAEEARRFCMAEYWNSGFSRKVPQDEASSIFNQVFTECLKEGIEREIVSFSINLSYLFEYRLISCIRTMSRIKRLNNMLKKPDCVIQDDNGVVMPSREGPQQPDPISNEDFKQGLIILLDSLERLTKPERDAHLLNVIGFTHEQVAHVLSLERQQVNNAKFRARRKLREIRSEKE
jgi:hypothetical protein